MDVNCAKCGEPWEAWGPTGFDAMDQSEADRFRAGKGCPACGFGTTCPSCSGSGEDAEYCKACGFNGMVLAWSPARSARRYVHGKWYHGYSPNVQEVPEGAEKVRDINGHESADGWTYSAFFRCWSPDRDSKHFKCGACNGSGKLTVEDPEGIEFRAAQSACDASDEDPYIILEQRGMV